MSLKIGRNDPCWCGSGKKYKKCHEAFDEKMEIMKQKGYAVIDHDLIKTPEQIAKIKESCKINIAVLDYVEEHIKPGVSTEEIDRWVHEETVRHGGIPAPLNYEGFPKSVCTSVNEVVCHGIPDEEQILKEGDIINVDVSTIYNGYYSDSSRMFCIGKVSPEKEKLVKVTKECVEIGISQVKPWTPIGNMGSAVHKHAVENGYSVVREIGGHGVGVEFHEDPWVSFVSEENTGVLMVPGMMFTIEPMVNMGSDEIYTDEIELKYFQNSFVIDFSTFDYSGTNSTKYTYRLDNYDKEWSIPSSLNFAAYKNLVPGTYKLRVKACNGVGVWGDKETILKIIVVPPFWKTTWAFFIYAILIGGALYITFRLMRDFNTLRNRIQVEKQLTEYKLVFSRISLMSSVLP